MNEPLIKKIVPIKCQEVYISRKSKPTPISGSTAGDADETHISAPVEMTSSIVH